MLQYKQRKGRIIFHIDMNCFYASVEIAHDPTLKGKPVAIAGKPEERKGIIITSSYEARAKGVKTTMPLWEARKRCPGLIVKRPNFTRYRHASREMFKLLHEITHLVEPVSIDEAYLDVTETEYSKGHLELAKYIQSSLQERLHLPCSIGIAPNKFLAKMASDMKKPLGITILRKRDIPHILWPMPVEEMHGVGKQTAKKLHAIQVKTIRDLAKKDVYALKQVLGINGERLRNRANGIDLRPVDPGSVHDLKSIGSSETLSKDTIDIYEIHQLIETLATNVARRVKRKVVAGRTVQIMIRYHDRSTITRSKKLPMYIENKTEIVQIATELINEHWNGEPIRLLGITLQDIEEKKHIAHQLDLFSYEKEAEKEKLYKTIDQLTTKYGKNPFKQLKDMKQDDSPRTSFQKDFLDDYLR